MDFMELNAEEAKALREALNSAHEQHGLRKLRIAFDEGAVKFKINEFTWSPPIGSKGEPY